MTETEYQAVKAKVLQEFPARQKLAKLAGQKLGDETLAELWMAAIVADDAVNPHEINRITRSALRTSAESHEKA